VTKTYGVGCLMAQTDNHTHPHKVETANWQVSTAHWININFLDSSSIKEKIHFHNLLCSSYFSRSFRFAFLMDETFRITIWHFINRDYFTAVVGNRRAAARWRSVRRSLPGRIIHQNPVSFTKLNASKHFCNVRSNYFRTFYKRESFIVQLLSHMGIVKMA